MPNMKSQTEVPSFSSKMITEYVNLLNMALFFQLISGYIEFCEGKATKLDQFSKKLSQIIRLNIEAKKEFGFNFL